MDQVFSESRVAAYAEASELYLWLLEQVGAPLSGAERAAVRYHLRLMALVMEAEDPLRVEIDAYLAEAAPAPSGAALVRWWRRRDALPASQNNERLQEHLSRAAIALRQYRSAEDERGFDDRGEVYLRLGQPTESTPIKIKSPALALNPLVSRLPENEVWVYRHVHDQAHYLFLRATRNQPFRLDGSENLIPADLRAGMRKAPLLLNIIEEIYAQLALTHAHYGQIYDDVAGYLALPTIGANTPYVFATRLMSQVVLLDEQQIVARRRVPAAYTNVAMEAAPLVVAFRWARFLCEGADTCVEVYWGLPARALILRPRHRRRLRRQGFAAPDDLLLSASLVQRNLDYETESIARNNYLVRAESTARLPARVLHVRQHAAIAHMALQWEQRWTLPGDGGARLPGPTVKLAIVAIDSVRALRKSGAIEMSDIKPLLSADALDLEGAAPYPFKEYAARTPLTLYFEIYHLTYGPDDQTHYRIDYRVAAPGETEADGREASTRYVGHSRTAMEYITLDIGLQPVPGPVTITIRSTDEVAQTSVERSIAFEIEGYDSAQQ